MDIGNLAYDVYFNLLGTGAITTSIGLALRGFGMPSKEDGVSRSVGVNNLLIKLFPSYNTIAPAVSHAFAFYGTTLFFGALSTFLLYNPSHSVNETTLFFQSFLPAVIALEALSVFGLVQDIKYKKTSLSDKIQWAAEFLTPIAAMGVAYAKLLY